MAADENKAILEGAVDRWNRGDEQGYLELYHEGAALHGYVGVGPGLEGIRRFYAAFWAAFPGSQLILEDMIAEGDTVAGRFTLEGTHRGEFRGMPPSGRPLSMAGITMLRFADGKCVERWTQADFAACAT